ncbi:hypothetical protein SCH4B_4139 [Ruegeria sp. TrichCH4B]|nr:hypothetical protein SCH4B_4139 [Ruegeria sp. TrichCH4B]
MPCVSPDKKQDEARFPRQETSSKWGEAEAGNRRGQVA